MNLARYPVEYVNPHNRGGHLHQANHVDQQDFNANYQGEQVGEIDIGERIGEIGEIGEVEEAGEVDISYTTRRRVRYITATLYPLSSYAIYLICGVIDQFNIAVCIAGVLSICAILAVLTWISLSEPNEINYSMKFVCSFTTVLFFMCIGVAISLGQRVVYNNRYDVPFIEMSRGFSWRYEHPKQGTNPPNYTIYVCDITYCAVYSVEGRLCMLGIDRVDRYKIQVVQSIESGYTSCRVASDLSTIWLIVALFLCVPSLLAALVVIMVYYKRT